VEEEKRWRIALENWVSKQEHLPTRKQLQAAWPEAPMKVVRIVLQSEKDRRVAPRD